MKGKLLALASVAVISTLLLSACEGDNGKDGLDGIDGTPGSPGASGSDGQDANSVLSLKLVGSTAAVADNFDESAAEIVAYHSDSKTAFLVNSNSKAVDVVTLEDVSAPAITMTLDVAGDVEAAVAELADGDLGGVNSVDVYDDHIIRSVRSVAIRAVNRYNKWSRAINFNCFIISIKIIP